jgi:hypothetical protein
MGSPQLHGNGFGISVRGGLKLALERESARGLAQSKTLCVEWKRYQIRRRLGVRRSSAALRTRSITRSLTATDLEYLFAEDL